MGVLKELYYVLVVGPERRVILTTEDPDMSHFMHVVYTLERRHIGGNWC